MTGATPQCFAVDRNLGKLAKKLRLMGFDTLLEPFRSCSVDFWKGVDPDCAVLVRSLKLIKILKIRKPLLIVSNDPQEQLCQVIRAFGLYADLFRPFSRCSICNLCLKRVDKEKVFGRVPDYVLQTQHEFRQCPGCRRIYWPGTHRERALSHLKRYNLGKL